MSRAAVYETSAAPQVEVVNCCPVCASRAAKELFTAQDKLCGLPGEFRIAQCSDCSLIYMKERLTSRAIGAYYPADYYAYKPPAAYSLFERADGRAALWYAVKRSILAYQYGYRHLGGKRLISALTRLPLLRALRQRATFALDVLLHPFVENGSLLEIGCGSGMYLDLMRALGWRRVAGVDISASAIAQARELLGLEAYCGELKDAGFAEESFDAVSLSHTLEHIAEPALLLGELCRIMKPNGRIAIVVPNGDSLAARRYGVDWFHLDAPRHMVNFTGRALATALGRAGFVIEQMTTRPAGSYDVALLSYIRQTGAALAVHQALSNPPLAGRIEALRLSLFEHALCSLGYLAGEELLVVARKAARRS